MIDNIDKLHEELAANDKKLKIYRNIMTFLTTLIAVMLVLMTANGGSIGGAFGTLCLVLLVIDLPFLYCTVKTQKACRDIKVKIEVLKQNDVSVEEYSDKKDLLTKLTNSKIRFMVFPIVLVVFLGLYISSKEFLWLLFAILEIIDFGYYFIKFKKANAELAEKGGLTAEEEAAFKAEMKKFFKKVIIITAVIVVFCIIISIATSKP